MAEFRLATLHYRWSKTGDAGSYSGMGETTVSTSINSEYKDDLEMILAKAESEVSRKGASARSISIEPDGLINYDR